MSKSAKRIANETIRDISLGVLAWLFVRLVKVLIAKGVIAATDFRPGERQRYQDLAAAIGIANPES